MGWLHPHEKSPIIHTIDDIIPIKIPIQYQLWLSHLQSSRHSFLGLAGPWYSTSPRTRYTFRSAPTEVYGDLRRSV